MKKFVSVFLIAVFALTAFSGCSFNRKKTAVVISGTEIDEEIYNFYLDRVSGRPSDYGLDAKASDRDKRDAAIKLCTKYIAFNTNFVNRGLSLTASEKVEIKDNVNSYWTINGKHYENIGVSRRTLSKIMTSEAYEKAIFNSVYDKGTDDKESEKKINKYFSENYIAFRNTCAYFTTSDKSQITEQEKQNITDLFTRIAASSGKGTQEFSDACAQAGYSPSDVVIMGPTSEGYPDGFYDHVKTMSVDTVKVLLYSDVIFAVRKENISELGDGVYAVYRSECIKEMYAEEWNTAVEDYISQFTVDEIKI